MTVRLLFFASLREQLGVSGENCELPPGVNTVEALRALLASRGEAWRKALDVKRALRAAVNQDMASADTVVKDGDEVAFFPPVTGG